MALRSENTIPPHLLMWQRVREYAVPPSMIETATARRAVGDWGGACAAARVDVDLDPRAVRERHGTELAARLRADLRRLAPDLLRWHMPRSAPDGRLRAGLTLSLVRYEGYGRHGAAPPHLVVRTPPAWADAGQRMSLAWWEEPSEHPAAGRPPHLDSPGHPHPHPDRRFRLDLHRHLWDAERADELARRCGASRPTPPEAPAEGLSADRLSAEGLLAGRLTPEALSAEGPPADGLPADGLPALHDYPWASTSWAAEAELLLRADGRNPRGAFTVRLGTRNRAVLELVAPDDHHAPTWRPLRETLPPQDVAALPVLPEAAARVLPDLELLRNGLIAADRLHPLVAGALAGSWPTTSAASPDAAPPPGDPHRVECRGEVHRIALRAGTLAAVDHDPAQLRREELLMAFGGPGLPCLRAIDAVHRDPEALPAVRERLGHGDIAGALAVVEGLLGPGAILRDGPLREELESAAARRIDHGLFRAGLADVYPGAGADGGAAASGDYAKASHRRRLDRHTPRETRLKHTYRGRPRSAQHVST
ncbi:hypothetical protein [Streptomyces liangshanensis]|uniref:Uncharacterized protein n=1 Tax=Streptomyces liangshanensis TaxID=2717324 RepID=A0A6G9GZD3_9ACTN|nr:hypothetical protein [Streptomyces liangshanensis]QIQ03643.1 hypothetical protein HA039_16065 [Streptomyces liangshanensis]